MENEANNEPEQTDPAVGESWEFITDQWQLEEPQMIISVTGGAGRFYMKPRMLKSFKSGLMKAATAAGEQCHHPVCAKNVIEHYHGTVTKRKCSK